MTSKPTERSDDDANLAQLADVGYGDALAELDSILSELEGSDVDVDLLAERVRRAAALIASCRERITGARLRIDAVIADLDGATAGAATDDQGHGTAGDADPA